MRLQSCLLRHQFFVSCHSLFSFPVKGCRYKVVYIQYQLCHTIIFILPV
ncbi:protein of unknown function [Cupriavidus taiwanensis]|uniref:Uncharacterized protein n=1 Tax=Cupriavidus taiwanensis TaxID=164546 RepID=A0A375IET7_9BURK|nr:hypothetical protein CBM2588_A80098 [Cupriavidus taiwanensis]SOY80133.1 hypothetical protein CBM2591_A130016 [Cupriavidus taiwanensis]SOZ50945.1 hypothetical protein CBM2617_A110092 [Cupriavidus taiwanensis]SOZ82064.1 hypothetical protein CBM2621_A120092 [Cupriavidus taiwanensis]SPD42973.1 protein of unknown function [Cupriavidus taiwanensis]